VNFVPGEGWYRRGMREGGKVDDRRGLVRYVIASGQ
jgi:hypothetical protein